jgi:biotin carboxylase
MAHLAMIESWTLSSGLLLPKAIRDQGHRYTLLCGSAARYSHFSLTGGMHPVMALAGRVVETDTNDAGLLLTEIERLHANDPFDGVLTSCDYYLHTVALAAEHLGLPGAGAATIKVAGSKHLMREAMRRAGLPGPDFAVVTSAERASGEARRIGYPLVAKPVDLCASQSVSLVRDDDELSKAFEAIVAIERNARGQRRDPIVLLEAYLEGPEFSVETVTWSGRTKVVGITDKSLAGDPYFVESGHMFPADLRAADADALATCAVEALVAVGYDTGVAHVEVKLTRDGPRVVEINTRVGGNWIAELVRRVRGQNLLNAMINCALGQPWTEEVRPTGIRSAAIQFLLSPESGRIVEVTGWDGLGEEAGIVDRQLRPDLKGRNVSAPRDNDDYLGYVMCVDPAGSGARDLAQSCVDRVRLRIAPQPSDQANRA